MSIINFKSEDFLTRIINMGYIIDEEKQILLNEFEEKYRINSNIVDNYQPIFTEIEISFIMLFKNELPNINYINFILILNALSIQDLKNVNRYINIKWNIVKNKLEENSNYLYLKNINFSDIYSINNLNDKTIILEKLMSYILNFSIKKDSLEFNLNLVFVINSIYDYFFSKKI